MRALQAGFGRVLQLSFDPKRPRLAACVAGTTAPGGGTLNGPQVVWLNTRTWNVEQALDVTRCARGCTWTEGDGGDVAVTDPHAAFPDGPTAFALSPDHRKVALAWPAMISLKWQQMTHWDLETGEGAGPWDGLREHYAEGLAFSPGGQYLTSWAKVNAFKDERGIELLGELRRVYFGEPVTAVAFTPDDAVLVYATEAGRVWGWEVVTEPSGRYLKLPQSDQEPAITASEGLRALAFSPDGRTLAIGSAPGVSLWRCPEGELIRALPTPAAVVALAFAPIGRLACCTVDGRVLLWNMRTGEASGPYGFVSGGAQVIAFAPDGLTCAAGGENGQVVVWDVDT